MKKTMKVLFSFVLITLMLPVQAFMQAEDIQTTQAYLTVQEQVVGENRVAYPVLAGMEDTQLQAQMNLNMYTALRVDELLLRLERIRNRGEEEQAQKLLYMQVDGTLHGTVYSIRVRIDGEQADGSTGDTVQCFTYDLKSGETIALETLFGEEMQGAVAAMESEIETELSSELNAYAVNSEMLPLPRENFYMDERGITFYYAPEQYVLLSGRVGACFFPYYVVERHISTADARFAPILDALKVPADAKERIAKDVKKGVLGTLPFALGMTAGEALDAHPLLNDPDYTINSLLYLFEEPDLRGAGIETWMYDEREEEARAITAIRGQHVDFYGLRPGMTTLEESRELLGAPQESITYDEGDAWDMLLVPGESDLYVFGENTLEIHADEEGKVQCLIVRAGKN